MQSVLISLALLGGLGAVFGLLLAFAAKKFAVESDPRVDEIEKVCPAPTAAPAATPAAGAWPRRSWKAGRPQRLPGGQGGRGASKIAEIMGTAAGDEEPKRRRCSLPRRP